MDLATLYLVQASVADSSAEAMPYPEFVARGWAVPNITNYHPFDRLGLWCAYMKEFSNARGSEDPDRVVAFARVVSVSLMDSFNVVDNPIRFPLLEPVRARSRHRIPMFTVHWLFAVTVSLIVAVVVCSGWQRLLQRASSRY